MKKAKTFKDAMEIIASDVAALKGVVKNAVVAAMKTYAERTAKDARATLNKPHWLLSRATSSKVIEYEDTGKVVAISGFERTTRGRNAKKGTPDPGIYARYYQGGQRRDVPAHFLRTAKARNVNSIPDNIATAFSQNVERLAAGGRLDDVDVEKR